MQFLVQGFFTMIVLFILSFYVANLPVTDTTMSSSTTTTTNTTTSRMMDAAAQRILQDFDAD